jgi:hypothetical protein
MGKREAMPRMAAVIGAGGLNRYCVMVMGFPGKVERVLLG